MCVLDCVCWLKLLCMQFRYAEDDVEEGLNKVYVRDAMVVSKRKKKGSIYIYREREKDTVRTPGPTRKSTQ